MTGDGLIKIDGSYGEGGGQIVRTCVSLAAITGQAIEIQNVRARRAKPGLQPQHLMAVRAAAQVCKANLTGDEIGTTLFRFEPTSKPRTGEYRFDIGTAGSAPLVAQTVLWPLAFADGDSSVKVIGGTHNPHAPSADYLEHVYFPVMKGAGLDADFSWPRPGFYPAGGGEVTLKINGKCSIAPVQFDKRSEVRRIAANIVVGSLRPEVVERAEQALLDTLLPLGFDVQSQPRIERSLTPGASVLLYSGGPTHIAGFLSLGERGKRMEKVAQDGADLFLKWHATGAAVDEHLADQLVLPMCFAKGKSRWSAPVLTEHLRTVLWVAQQFCPVQSTVEQHEQLHLVELMRPDA